MDKYTYTITRTQDAVRVLATVIRFQRDDDGMCWTSLMLSEHTGIPLGRCRAALQWLLKKGLAWYSDDEYGATADGRAYHRACIRNPLLLQAEFGAWKKEARSGMSEDGKETKIENPVIPK